MKDLAESSVCKVTDIDRHRVLLPRTPVEKCDKHFILRVLAKHIMPAFDNACIGDDIALCRQREQCARLQCHMRIARTNHLCERMVHILMHLVLPRKRAAVIRVFEPLHCHFITIVNGRNTGVGHLKQRRHVKALQADSILLVTKSGTTLVDSRHPFVTDRLTEHRKSPFDIMAADEVHHRIEILCRIVLAQAFKTAHCQRTIISSEEIIEKNCTQRIVHCTVHLVTTEILPLLTIGDLV